MMRTSVSCAKIQTLKKKLKEDKQIKFRVGSLNDFEEKKKKQKFPNLSM